MGLVSLTLLYTCLGVKIHHKTFSRKNHIYSTLLVQNMFNVAATFRLVNSFLENIRLLFAMFQQKRFVVVHYATSHASSVICPHRVHARSQTLLYAAYNTRVRLSRRIDREGEIKRKRSKDIEKERKKRY